MEFIPFESIQNLIFVGLLLALVMVAKFIYNLTTSYNTYQEITEQRNSALAISVSGFLLAVVSIYGAVLYGPSQGLLNDVLIVSSYSGLGLVLLVASRFLNDQFILHGQCNKTELIENQNTATGLVQAASYLASGLMICGALAGDGGWLSAVVFYAIAQVLLVVFARLYDFITRYSLQTQLQQGNKAVAVSFSATLVALGLILFHALMGEFIDWQQSLTLFFIDAVIAFVLLPVTRLIIDKILFHRVCIDKEISEHQNIAIALLEGTVAICVGLTIVFAL